MGGSVEGKFNLCYLPQTPFVYLCIKSNTGPWGMPVLILLVFLTIFGQLPAKNIDTHE